MIAVQSKGFNMTRADTAGKSNRKSSCNIHLRAGILWLM